jgi:hypothetical protein
MPSEERSSKRSIPTGKDDPIELRRFRSNEVRLWLSVMTSAATLAFRLGGQLLRALSIDYNAAHPLIKRPLSCPKNGVHHKGVSTICNASLLMTS